MSRKIKLNFQYFNLMLIIHIVSVLLKLAFIRCVRKGDRGIAPYSYNNYNFKTINIDRHSDPVIKFTKVR